MTRFYKLSALLFAAVLCVTSTLAMADGLDLAYKNTKNFPTMTAAGASGDTRVVFDASDDKWKTIDPRRDIVGRATITICGDATTVNNNTIYYGPSRDIQAGYGRTCDITAAGNATEATADLPAFDATAFQITDGYCQNDQDANADISFTVRSAEAAVTPAMTCTIADGGRNCMFGAGTTTAIASGATLAIAAASTSDVGTAQFQCVLNVAYYQ